MSEYDVGVGGSELTVSVGGTTIVSTDVVLAEAEMLRYAQAQAEDFRVRVDSIRQLDSAGGAMKWTPGDAGIPLLWASGTLGELEQRSGDLAESLVAAAERYGWAERSALQLAVLGSAKVGHDVGTIIRLMLLLGATPLVLGVMATSLPALGLVVWAMAGLVKRETGYGFVLDQRVITDPQTVLMAKLLVSSLDDVALGALGVPLGVDLILGDTGLGVTGISSTAVAVLAVARSGGLLREGAVRVRRVRVLAKLKPPTGVSDVAARIPKAAKGGAQIRIEKYGDGEQTSWAVYIGGTVDWDPVATNEPFDLASNVSAIAEENAGSFRAVMEAMQAAGIEPGDPVVVAGHSQGGIVATQVAASEAFNVQAVATFGAPETCVPVPSGVATLTVEHSDDVVTALGGSCLIDSEDRLTVRREVFATTEPPVGENVPAHHLDRYRETAQLIDASPEENLQNFQDTVTGIVGSAEGEAVLWRGIRLPAGPAPK
ncbi:hypothetical protein E3T46_02930 [Cryobacterium sp. Hh11]|uniref:alpha/beta hydrolase n=1 Tax=Cryobacterium sp. Hh11 TaxID=2555868 RepID=UPI00106D7CBD|nr:alpha/beta hydrolase [Cryobacterium sp. Hh11]TFD53839.1 hypothetical protein E3T46_02930 [Cryobacterium sp. Hh11]